MTDANSTRLWAFPTDIRDPFLQREGEVYWLDISVDLAGESETGQLGWKTSENHFMDDAVYWDIPRWRWIELELFTGTLQADDIIGCVDTGITLLYPKTLPPFDLSDPRQRRMQEVFQEALGRTSQPSQEQTLRLTARLTSRPALGPSRPPWRSP